ncbi:unnamed protein product [Adineta steineri]|uniref:Uncharacterized protein n=1 Tax=Adineta steineri TaxID=433720 RepID=A0A819GD37_9BILA|nr:unnamed protein product [Adineta steineri]CAF3879688.1 unnamed protein product [Adineta steineri]
MHTWGSNNPPEKQSRHSYSLEQFSLTKNNTKELYKHFFLDKENLRSNSSYEMTEDRLEELRKNVSFIHNRFNIIYLPSGVEKYGDDHDHSIDKHPTLIDIEDEFMNDVHRKADSLGEDIESLSELIITIECLHNTMLQEPQPNIQNINELEEKRLKMRHLGNTIRNNFNEMKEMQGLEANTARSKSTKHIIDKLFENEHPFLYPKNLFEFIDLCADYFGVFDIIYKQKLDKRTIEDQISKAAEYSENIPNTLPPKNSNRFPKRGSKIISFKAYCGLAEL